MKARYILTRFQMSDVEDPELYCAEPIHQWQQTSEGKFCMEKAEDPTYDIEPDHMTMGYRVTITGILEDKYATFLALKQS